MGNPRRVVPYRHLSFLSRPGGLGPVGAGPPAAQVSAHGDTRLRIWSAGCASGEEPYTLALVLALGRTRADCESEIVATDADPCLLRRAGRACYPESSLRELPTPWRTAFRQVGDELCLHPRYRESVRFLEQDIRRSQPDGRFDLILCRNLVFTYFQLSRQSGIAARLAEKLVPGGLLLLGSHESLPEPVPGLEREQAWLYRRRTEKGQDESPFSQNGRSSRKKILTVIGPTP
jgi:chemotaxis protein methyltransferase CheR